MFHKEAGSTLVLKVLSHSLLMLESFIVKSFISGEKRGLLTVIPFFSF